MVDISLMINATLIKISAFHYSDVWRHYFLLQENAEKSTWEKSVQIYLLQINMPQKRRCGDHHKYFQFKNVLRSECSWACEIQYYRNPCVTTNFIWNFLCAAKLLLWWQYEVLIRSQMYCIYNCFKTAKSICLYAKMIHENSWELWVL
jgi:hypothetical protein